MSEALPVFKLEDQQPETSLPPEDIEQMFDGDEMSQPTETNRFAFPLRGNSLNPIIDVSSSLIALIVRIADLSQFSDIDMLHKDVHTEIESIELELHRLGYERTIILAHRYCLCSAIDEAIMCSEWGQESNWSEKSLLALFHNETWGGEKFFVVLNRVLQDPTTYLDLIEFMYLLLTLGFEGRYRVTHNGKAQLEEILRDLHKTIRNERGQSPEVLLSTKDKIVQKAHKIRRQTPVSIVWITLLVACVSIYLIAYYLLDQYSDQVVDKLRSLI